MLNIIPKRFIYSAVGSSVGLLVTGLYRKILVGLLGSSFAEEYVPPAGILNQSSRTSQQALRGQFNMAVVRQFFFPSKFVFLLVASSPLYCKPTFLNFFFTSIANQMCQELPINYFRVVEFVGSFQPGTNFEPGVKKPGNENIADKVQNCTWERTFICTKISEQEWLCMHQFVSFLLPFQFLLLRVSQLERTARL